MVEKLRIGARRSDLALIQANIVADMLKEKTPSLETQIVVKVADGDVGKAGGFVKVFEDALLAGEIDIAVHFGKDLPLKMDERLDFCAAARADERNVAVFLKGAVIKDGYKLRKYDNTSLRIAASSHCRKMQIEHLLQAECQLLNRNIPVQIARLRENELDCVVVAASAIERLRLNEENYLDFLYFDIADFTPPCAQSVIAVEFKKEEEEIAALIRSLADEKTTSEIRAERYLLGLLGGREDERMGVNCHIEEGKMRSAAVIEKDGTLQRAYYCGDAINWSYLCDKTAEKLSRHR